MENNKPILNLLKSKKQIILQGAPGTGKTYKTAEIAVELCDGTIPSSREELMKRYRELRDEGRIGFTTFHQSMDYEEFIEGIKPNVDEATKVITYDVEKGIFLKMCEVAAKPIIKDNPLNIGPAPTVWKVSLGGTGINPVRTDCMKNGYIRIGWDEYGDFQDDDIDYSKYGGKTNLDAFRNKMQVGDIVFSCFSSKEIDAIGIVTGDYEFHDEFSGYKRLRKVQWLVKGIQENIFELNGKTVMTLSTVYRLNAITIDKVFSLLAKYKVGSGSTIEENKNPYILIIDEINRGNISKIFGELITLLEADKRKGKVNEVSATLTYSKETFSVPDNLYIIGTMNTADRSIGYIDYAVRRRFSFYTLLADRSIVENFYENETLAIKATSLFDAVKNLISTHISPEFNPSDLMVGHSYFLAEDEDELISRLEYEVKPLLYEYANDGILINLEKEAGRYPAINAIGSANGNEEEVK